MTVTGGEFFGRSREISELVMMLRNPDIRVVCLFGKSGIGKTKLADEVYAEVFERFQHKVMSPSFRLDLPGQALPGHVEDWLVSSIASKLSKKPMLNPTRNELESAILDSVAETPTLLFLDAVETLEVNWLNKFVNDWLQRDHSSCLLLTSTRPLTIFSDNARYRSLELHGLRDDEEDAILQILGAGWTNIPREERLAAARELQNNPQKLIYLKIHAPKDIDELRSLVKSLNRQDGEYDLSERIDASVGGPITHFLSLARLRTDRVEESLLSWMWHVLGSGSTDAYFRVRDRLVELNLLDRVSGAALTQFRLAANIQISMEKLLLQRIGRLHIPHIDYYLAEYHRRWFILRNDKKDLTLLGRYVQHSLDAGNLTGALDFLLVPTMLREFHHLACALSLRPIFEALNHRLDSEPTRSDLSPRELLWRASVKIELASCHNDLSEHEECLRLLEEAERSLADPNWPKEQMIEERQRINFLRGVAFSRLGRSEESIRAYMSVVQQSVTREFDERAVLALGYIAYEITFHHEISMARMLGQDALKLAQFSGDASVMCKTNCSIGQVLLFSGDIAGAARMLNKAEEECRSGPGVTDQRELGRILICQGIVKIAQTDYRAALKTLDDATELSKYSGDRRRHYRATGLRAIAAWRLDRSTNWKEVLEEAIKMHLTLKDWRLAVVESLSYLVMAGFELHTLEDVKLLKPGNDELWVNVFETVDPIMLQLYGTYWFLQLKPLLFPKRENIPHEAEI